MEAECETLRGSEDVELDWILDPFLGDVQHPDPPRRGLRDSLPEAPDDVPAGDEEDPVSAHGEVLSAQESKTFPNELTGVVIVTVTLGQPQNRDGYSFLKIFSGLCDLVQ